MKIRYMIIVSLILAILTIGTVCATENIDTLTVDDAEDEPVIEAPVDEIDALTVDDAGDEPVEVSGEEVEILETSDKEILGDPTAKDFHFVIEKEVSVKNPDATVISFQWPDEVPAPCSISIRVVGTSHEAQFAKFSKITKVTLSDLSINSVGTYTLLINYMDDQFLTTGTVNVVESTAKNAVKLTLKKVDVKKSAKKLVLKATLKINGKAKKGLKVKFKFNKKTYTAKTNTKGIAKVSIKKSVLKKLKVGKKITYSASYGKTIKKVTVKVKK